jgi:dipeptidase
MYKLLSTALLLAMFVVESVACTNIIITRGASADGSTMVSYSADSHVLYGELYHWNAASYNVGDSLEVREWDTNRFLGYIPQVARTYNVVGNMNEHGLAIAETTFGGRKELVDTTSVIDYGSLIYITLARATNAREAIKVMTELVSQHGFCSGGESFSIADPDEAWIMEMVGKGTGQKGALWVAVRIPDGCVSGHANQARITTFPLNDSDNCLYAPDVISFARQKGYFKSKDKDFSFADAYAPLDFGAVRFCEARVWCAFLRMNKAEMAKYESFALGIDMSQRLPLYIKPDHKITRREVADLMRDHYEGTALDMTKDIGAGPFELPYRWRPMEWEVDSVQYLHERATATQQTGFWFVAQLRPDKPSPRKGILWFGCDDAATSVLVPFYGCTTVVPHEFAVGNGDLLTYSNTSMFWIMNRVAHQAYLGYNKLYPDIRKAQQKLDDEFEQAVQKADADIEKLSSSSHVIDYANLMSTQLTKHLFDSWKVLDEFLFVKYLDGNKKQESNGQFLRTETQYPADPAHPEYSEHFYKVIADQTGDHLKTKY